MLCSSLMPCERLQLAAGAGPVFQQVGLVQRRACASATVVLLSGTAASQVTVLTMHYATHSCFLSCHLHAESVCSVTCVRLCGKTRPSGTPSMNLFAQGAAVPVVYSGMSQKGNCSIAVLTYANINLRMSSSLRSVEHGTTVHVHGCCTAVQVLGNRGAAACWWGLCNLYQQRVELLVVTALRGGVRGCFSLVSRVHHEHSMLFPSSSHHRDRLPHLLGRHSCRNCHAIYI